MKYSCKPDKSEVLEKSFINNFYSSVKHAMSMDYFVNLNQEVLSSKTATEDKLVANVVNQSEFDESDTEEIPGMNPA